MSWKCSLSQLILGFGMNTFLVNTETEIVKKELLIQVILCKRMLPGNTASNFTGFAIYNCPHNSHLQIPVECRNLLRDEVVVC